MHSFRFELLDAINYIVVVVARLTFQALHVVLYAVLQAGQVELVRVQQVLTLFAIDRLSRLPELRKLLGLLLLDGGVCA
jgi:hypothetical protein